jgi:hypothetical protein
MKTVAALFVVALAGTAVAGPVNTGGSGSGLATLNNNRAILWDQSTTAFANAVDQDFPDFRTSRPAWLMTSRPAETPGTSTPS